MGMQWYLNLRMPAIPERLKRCVHDEALYKSTFTFTLPYLFSAPAARNESTSHVVPCKNLCACLNYHNANHITSVV